WAWGSAGPDAVTVAPGSTAPVWSCTSPTMRPRSSWAVAVPARARPAARHTNPHAIRVYTRVMRHLLGHTPLRPGRPCLTSEVDDRDITLTEWCQGDFERPFGRATRGRAPSRGR